MNGFEMRLNEEQKRSADETLNSGAKVSRFHAQSLSYDIARELEDPDFDPASDVSWIVHSEWNGVF